ncbi:centrosomal protein of 95 kDa-like isoform X2 [Gouania willdenowi]|uniref:DUF5745 domain-containing protein n=1 Tax=Gouania willdenowi TaxID=441366 RepID=A0A8C5GSN5_GOUWI|nr:centrosomal protein of 95 kDa isoform X2 [Gouania willdenowi]
MGTQEGERDWVDVANDLLSRCHIKLKLGKLEDCSADVFIALYENILGEKVPDYITAPCSQEDDVHNVQSVIDSLSLDYLQISLSHITGENVARGDKESIRNLLEIFDGLLEYLNEEMNEESQDREELNGSVSEASPGEKKTSNCGTSEEKDSKLEESSLSSTVESALQSSKQSLHSWNAEELGSTGEELIGLGVSARTFRNTNEGITLPPQASDDILSSSPVNTEQAPQTAIALQPPTQCNSLSLQTQLPSSHSSSDRLSQSHSKEEQTAGTAQTSEIVAEPCITNGQQSPAASDKSLTSQQRGPVEGEMGETLEPTNGGPRKVLFRTQPDVLFLTLQDEVVPTTLSPPDTEEEQDEEDLNYIQNVKDRQMGHEDKTDHRRALEERLSYRRERNKQTEEELHLISENLSHRLEELDRMLKRVLVESGESNEVIEADQHSHHSSGNRECPTEHTGEGDPEPSSQAGSPSPSRPAVFHAQEQVDEARVESLGLNDKRQTNIKASDHSRKIELRQRPLHRKTSKHLKNKFFMEELKRFEEEERTALDRERLKAQEAEREYREAILGDISPSPRGSSSNPKTRHKLQKHHDTRRKASSLKVRENELLPLLREELPHLHISPHALGRMWEQQMQQMDRLHSVSSSHGPRRSKLSSQVEEAQRKHDLLVELVRKDKEHSRRLRDFKDRIQQQKSTQNRLREQRQQVARAKKYHNDYHVQHRARLMKDRTKEERMFRQLFEDGLELQKVRLREQRAFAKEQRQEHQRRHQDQIKSMENYYKDQFSLMAEKLAQERQDIQVRKKAQEKALLKMKRELRSKMEREIGELQKIVIQNNEDDYFQDLEVQRLRSRLQMASFHYNTSYLH